MASYQSGWKFRCLFILFSIGLLVNCRNGFAAPVSFETARQVAEGFMAGKRPATAPYAVKSLSDIRSAEVFTATREALPVYRVINLEPEGWVIVAADDVSAPVIGYSEKGRSDEQNQPPAFVACMENVKATLKVLPCLLVIGFARCGA